MADARIRRCTDPGTSVLIGTVDANGAPATCRGIALVSADGCATATVYAPMATSQQTIANLAATGRLAVVACHPIDHCATQLKGHSRAVRLATDEEGAFVRRRLEEFADVLDQIGTPRRVTRRLAHWPAFAIEMQVDEIYDQTPGPKAGARMR
jgi:hypothetical protein